LTRHVGVKLSSICVWWHSLKRRTLTTLMYYSKFVIGPFNCKCYVIDYITFIIKFKWICKHIELVPLETKMFLMIIYNSTQIYRDCILWGLSLLSYIKGGRGGNKGGWWSKSKARYYITEVGRGWPSALSTDRLNSTGSMT